MIAKGRGAQYEHLDGGLDPRVGSLPSFITARPLARFAAKTLPSLGVSDAEDLV